VERNSQGHTTVRRIAVTPELRRWSEQYPLSRLWAMGTSGRTQCLNFALPLSPKSARRDHCRSRIEALLLARSSDVSPARANAHCWVRAGVGCCAGVSSCVAWHSRSKSIRRCQGFDLFVIHLDADVAERL